MFNCERIEEEVKAAYRPLMHALEGRFYKVEISYEEFSKQFDALSEEMWEAVFRAKDANERHYMKGGD